MRGGRAGGTASCVIITTRAHSSAVAASPLHTAARRGRVYPVVMAAAPLPGNLIFRRAACSLLRAVTSLTLC